MWICLCIFHSHNWTSWCLPTWSSWGITKEELFYFNSLRLQATWYIILSCHMLSNTLDTPSSCHTQQTLETTRNHRPQRNQRNRYLCMYICQRNISCKVDGQVFLVFVRDASLQDIHALRTFSDLCYFSVLWHLKRTKIQKINFSETKPLKFDVLLAPKSL